MTEATLDAPETDEATDAAPEQQHKWVYLFEEGNGENKSLFGGKGAGLSEMTRARLAARA